MDINELEKQLREEIDSYRDHVHAETDNYKKLPKEMDKEERLFNMVEELHRQNYYALLGMKENIIKYLKDNN